MFVNTYQIANTLIDYAIKNFQYKQIFEKDKVVCSVSVKAALKEENSDNTKCVIPNDIFALIPKDTDLSNEITYKTFLHETELVAPIEKNAVVGGVHIYCGDVLIAESPIVINESVESNAILSTLDGMKAFFTSRFFIILLIILIPTLIIYISTVSVKSRHKKVKTVKYKNFY